MVTAPTGARLLVLATTFERLIELVLSERHRRWAVRRGGMEFGREHYPAMVALHAGLLTGCALRAWGAAPAAPALTLTRAGILLGAQALRWWCIASLGRQWNTRIVVIPGASRCRRGPYRWWRHPNYAAVTVEGVVLPLAVGSRRLAAAFAVANGVMLVVRTRVEDRALSLLSDGAQR